MAVDFHRDLLLVFGADTHHEDYDNSVYRLDLRTLRWSRDYEPDHIEDYHLMSEGYPVTRTGRPWAMHTYDAVDYEPTSRALLAVSLEEHAYLIFERYGIDPKQMVPSVWYYHPDTRQWELRKIPDTPNLFAKAMAWDPDRGQMIATTGTETWHFGPRQGTWRPTATGGPAGHHLKLVYDTRGKRMLSYGSNLGGDVLWAYDPDRAAWSVVRTERKAPPGNGAALAYDGKNGLMVFVAVDGPNQYENPSGRSQTWIFDSAAGDWQHLDTWTPPVYGINNHIDYDPNRDVVLYGESDTFGRLALWALRIA
jgi:hypothetical protein